MALAAVQHEAGLVSMKELQDLKLHEHNIDIKRILEIEKETKHDVVAAIREYAEKAKIGGGKIHLGATSMDIVDNTDTVRLQEGLKITEEKLYMLLKLFAEKIIEYADVPSLGFTHLQAAEPTTVGYRLAYYAQDLLVDYHFLQFAKLTVKGKGFKGAVGSAASYHALLKDTKMPYETFEKRLLQKLGIDAVSVSSQVYPRKFDFLVLSVLSSISSSAAKFAGDLRILQSPGFGEWSEPFGKKQVGSSAMPFKKNPLHAEKICSLARYISVLPNVALENATVSYLERTLDDSANKRIILPNAFLAVDEILHTAVKLVGGLIISEKKVAFNLSQYAPFAATEGILMEAVKKGADRQKMHETLRDTSLQAWNAIQNGQTNPMERSLIKNTVIKHYVSEKRLYELLDVRRHTGNAGKRARKLVKEINKIVSTYYTNVDKVK